VTTGTGRKVLPTAATGERRARWPLFHEPSEGPSLRLRRQGILPRPQCSAGGSSATRAAPAPIGRFVHHARGVRASGAGRFYLPSNRRADLDDSGPSSDPPDYRVRLSRSARLCMRTSISSPSHRGPAPPSSRSHSREPRDLPRRPPRCWFAVATPTVGRASGWRHSACRYERTPVNAQRMSNSPRVRRGGGRLSVRYTWSVGMSRRRACSGPRPCS
jgi:hypothetical protein